LSGTLILSAVSVGCARSRSWLLSGGKGMRAGGDCRHIDARLGSILELIDELGQGRDGLPQKTHDRGRTRESVVENTVQQVLDGPRELTQLARTDHTAAAFECVERATHGHERLAIHGILVPRREMALDLGQLLMSLLDEELDQLRIRVLRQSTHDRCA
jgi:hypothetical protein